MKTGWTQPLSQASSRYPNERRRVGTHAIGLGEFTPQALQVTSHPKSPETTSNETRVDSLHIKLIFTVLRKEVIRSWVRIRKANV